MLIKLNSPEGFNQINQINLIIKILYPTILDNNLLKVQIC